VGIHNRVYSVKKNFHVIFFLARNNLRKTEMAPLHPAINKNVTTTHAQFFVNALYVRYPQVYQRHKFGLR